MDHSAARLLLHITHHKTVWVTAILRPHSQALRSRLAPVQSSTEVLTAHALAMFKRSMELQTGPMMWTRGELLGEGAFGKVCRGCVGRCPGGG